MILKILIPILDFLHTNLKFQNIKPNIKNSLVTEFLIPSQLTFNSMNKTDCVTWKKMDVSLWNIFLCVWGKNSLEWLLWLLFLSHLTQKLPKTGSIHSLTYTFWAHLPKNSYAPLCHSQSIGIYICVSIQSTFCLYGTNLIKTETKILKEIAIFFLYCALHTFEFAEFADDNFLSYTL